MILIGDGLWIGNSGDGLNLGALGIRGLLNVAQDLRGWCGWPEVEYMQVGLIDGPGNPPGAYHAAVLALATLRARGSVGVCCHTGSRSLAVAMMYMEASRVNLGWATRLALLQERVYVDLPVPHEAHQHAFDRMRWAVLKSMISEV